MAERIIRKSSLVELADIIRGKSKYVDAETAYITNKSAFNICSLPEGLTSIGDYAFRSCTNLALTSLPEGLISIGDYAFDGCTNLALTSLPEGLTSIGDYAFRGCAGLATLTFKDSPTIIGSHAFSNCTNLTTINVPWSEGEVANAPWGATNAAINYNYAERE